MYMFDICLFLNMKFVVKLQLDRQRYRLIKNIGITVKEALLLSINKDKIKFD